MSPALDDHADRAHWVIGWHDILEASSLR